MSTQTTNAFGPGFVPGKVREDKGAASQALGRRWSGLPAREATEGVDRPPSTRAVGEPGSTGTWSAL